MKRFQIERGLHTNQTIKTVTLAYFSGTGCTEAIVDCFEKQFVELGINSSRIKITSCTTHATAPSDLLILLSPVYAFRLTAIVDEWCGLPRKTQKFDTQNTKK